MQIKSVRLIVELVFQLEPVMDHPPPATRSPAHILSPIPVVKRFSAVVSDAERTRLQAIAEQLIHDEPALAMVDAFGPSVRSGMREGPLLILGDHSDIPLIGGEAADLYQYRMALLARSGDLVALSVQRNEVFETYLSQTLKLGSPRYVDVRAPTGKRANHLALSCIKDQNAFNLVAGIARAAGCLTIVPHIGTGYPWRLASAVATAADCAVDVAASPPRLTNRVNNKLWFSDLVARVLGRTAQPECTHVFGPASLVGRLKRFARKYDRMVVKVPDSAGSAGNIVFDAKSVRELSSAALHDRVLDLLRNLSPTKRFPLQAQVWDCSIRSTPSIQLWLPHRGDGPPVIEGIYEQVVEGPGSEFVGSRPAKLPSGVIEIFADEGSRLADVLQACGYFGRCSFDAVIGERDDGQDIIHWIECNGRWGGVSLPMTLVNRLVSPSERSEFVVVQRYAEAGQSLRTKDVLETLSRQLYLPRTRTGGVLLLSPAGDGSANRLHFAAIGNTPEAAMAHAREAVGAVLGLAQVDRAQGKTDG